MRVNRGLLFWGIALLTAGIVALAIQSEAIASDWLGDAWRLWPLVLIAIGVAIVFARGPLGLLGSALGGLIVGVFAGALISSIPFGFAGCGDAPMRELTSREGTFGSRPEVSIDFNCGGLDVSLEAGNAWSLDLARGGGSEPRVDAGDDSLRVETRGRDFGPFAERRHEWDVVLPADVELDLDVRVNAAESRLDLAAGDLRRLELRMNAGSAGVDLSGARVRDLAIDMNGGSVSMIADAGTQLSGSLDYNAGSVELCVPGGVGIAITLDDPNITFGHNLDERGLERRGETWVTPGADAASASVRLTVDGNAASLTLNPTGGCR